LFSHICLQIGKVIWIDHPCTYFTKCSSKSYNCHFRAWLQKIVHYKWYYLLYHDMVAMAFHGKQHFGPTCFLNAIEYLVEARIFVTKSRNNLFSSCVNTNGAYGLKKFVTLGFFGNHKCCCRPTSSMSYFTSIMSLSPNKYSISC
jgi:hypothetical protein